MLDNKKYTAILDLEEKGFVSSINTASNSLSGFSGMLKGAFSTMVGFAMFDIGSKLVGGLKDATMQGIQYNASLEQSNIAWTTLLGTQAKAVKMLSDIQDYAKKTPFENTDVDYMAKQLHNADLRGKEMFDTMTMLGDIGSAFNVPIDSLKEMTRQYSQVQQAQVAYTEDLNILQDRGVPILKGIAKVMDIPVEKVKKMASEGKISADVYNKALQSIYDGSYSKEAKNLAGAMDQQSKSLNGMLSTSADSFKQIMGYATKDLFEGLRSSLESFMPTLEGITDAFREGGFIGAIKKYMPQALPFIQMLGSTIKNTFTQIQGVATVFQSFWAEHGALILSIMKVAWFLILAVIQSVISSIIGVVKGGLQLIDGIIDLFSNLFKGNFKGVWEAIKQIFSSAVGLIWNIMNLLFLSKLKGLFTAFKTGSINIITSLWTGLKSIFSGGVTGIINFIKNLVTTGTSNFNTLKTFGASSFQALFSVGKTMVGNLLNAVKSTMGLVPTTIRNLMNTAVGVLRSINLFSIGKNMIQGLINGIKNMGGSIRGAIGGIVNSAVSSAKSKLGIHSPSRVFKQLGEYTGEGFNIGITNTEQDTKNAIKSLTGTAINSVAQPQATSSGAMSFVLNINNPSVRSDSDINKLAQQIDIKLKEFESRSRKTRGGVVFG